GEIVAAYTEVVDRMVRYLYEAASADFARRNVRLSQKCAVLAQGGYGRGELNPGSDVDLLFLYSWKVNPFVESVTEKILYCLWDTGLQVGHAVRSVSECVRLAAKDFKVKTALLDTRFLCGDLVLYGEFDRAMKNEVLKKSADRFFDEKVAESIERHQRYGDSVYLLEPHIKEGEGGLRDLHTALWMARVKYKIDALPEIVQKGVVSERELLGVLESRDFLWRVRNTLHFLANGHQDQLTFEYQEQVAKTLGYRDQGEQRAVERFLQDVYLHADKIRRFARLVVDRCVDKPVPYRRFGRPFGREIRPGVRILDREISLEGPEVVKEDPVNLVALFLESQRHGVPLSSRTRDLLRDLGPQLDGLRDSPPVIATFVEILRGRARVAETLRDMHQVGVLDHLVPEFGQLRFMVIR
ncbi:MAG: nucleotidyltransferase domain-containing protein, partial [Candidatus Binatia bacterium]